jgi:hypothetical protein
MTLRSIGWAAAAAALRRVRIEAAEQTHEGRQKKRFWASAKTKDEVEDWHKANKGI